MPEIACLGYSHTCACGRPHCGQGVIVQTQSKRVYVSGLPIALEGDRGHCCAPVTLLSSSSRLIVEGRRVHLVGDKNTCNGVTLPGSGRIYVS